MGDAAESQTNDNETAANGKKRDRSTIEFPYTDLGKALDLVRKLHQIAGQAATDRGQLAVALDQSVDGGTFRGLVSAARMFGLVRPEGGTVQLTSLGLQAIDSPTERAAKAEAFLNVPLYQAMFDRYNGYALPPAAAIERQMEQLGVAPKQAERARQAFASSAAVAEFINPNGRFSKPVLAAPDAGGGGGGAGSSNNDGGPHTPPPPPPPYHPPPQITEKALEYRLVDLMADAMGEQEVLQAIIKVVTFLKARDASKNNTATDQ